MIKIGTFIQLEHVLDTKTLYKCRVVGSHTNKIHIDYPINEETNRTEIFPVGTRFRINFIEGNSVYSFPTEIIKKGKEKNIPILVLSFNNNNMKKIQRREFVRVQALLDTSVHSVEGNFAPFTTVTHDISGGGLALLIDKNNTPEKDTLVDIVLVLPLDNHIEYLKMKGKVVKLHPREGEKDILSIKFEEIDRQEQQKIVRFCFLKQLEERRKGLS